MVRALINLVLCPHNSKLSDERYDILASLRGWEESGVWVLAYVR